MRAFQTAGIAGILGLFALTGCTQAQGGDMPAEAPGAPSDAPAAAEPSAQPRLPEAGKAWVVFGADTVVAEVASTPDERAQGLMYRQEVPDGTGMLFVFEDTSIRSFWMQNTYVALDIAFLNAAFVVVDIQQMEPQTTDPHESTAAAMFALEVRKGWFAEQGIRVGAQARIVFGVR